MIGDFTHELERILVDALKEDIGNGDITTDAVIPDRLVSRGVLVAKSSFIISGLPFVERVFHLVDRDIKFKASKKEGSRVRKGQLIASVEGKTKGLLKAERTALNLFQRMSGIATLTADYVERVKGLNVKIADTRKTAPGLRYFDKYAVRTGGGHNHRFGLFDGILIKDNHISAAGGITEAVSLARKKAHHLLKIEVEVKTLDEVKKALKAGADLIMLDNMSQRRMMEAVQLIRGTDNPVIIEASGNVTIDNVRLIAETGVDVISVGTLTHSAPAADISMKID
jgi:nicotinate-nucleotide pyrophosphorylase (carboxylating)